MLIRPAIGFDTTGERVDIKYSDEVDFETLDMFQKSHYKRYEFALERINKNDVCGDLACGTGYGSAMLAKKAWQVIGVDLNKKVIQAISKRYKKIKNVQFSNKNLLDLSLDNVFDAIISFETIEHFTEQDIVKLLGIYNKSLKQNGRLIISTPYKQERDEAALKLGHHLTFYIDEQMITGWLTNAGFEVEFFNYQNYATHTISTALINKDFVIGVAKKIK